MNVSVNTFIGTHKNHNRDKVRSVNSPILLKHFVLKTSNHARNSAK